MTQEEKELLLKDLCARLQYGVKISVQSWDEREMEYMDKVDVLYSVNGDEYIKSTNEDYDFSLEEVKPYLFPLSSMTKEQKKEISKRYNYHNPYQLSVEITNHREGYWDDDNSCNLQDYLWLEDWFNKNHFDYRGLIEKELAIDATGLNIY